MTSELARRTQDAPHDLGAIRGEGIGLFWFILFQHAKFAGAKFGDPELETRTIADLWDIGAAFPVVAAILEYAETAMMEAMRHYPNLPTELRDDLSGCFIELAEAFGYRFRDAFGRDGVWWDRGIQANALGRLSTSTIT